MNAAESDRPVDRQRIRQQQRRLILPLLLTLLVGGAWWWSYRSLERYLLAGYGGQVNEIVLMRGVFMAGASSESIGSHDAFTVRRLSEPFEEVANSSTLMLGGVFVAGLGMTPYDDQFALIQGGFNVHSDVRIPLAKVANRDEDGKLISTAVLFPIWFFLPLIGLWLGWVVLKIRQTRRAAAEGCCQKCGYDLRASADRCPECGEAVPAKGVAA